MVAAIIPTMAPSIKKNKAYKNFFIDAHNDFFGAGGAGQALISPRGRFTIGLPEASSGTPVSGSNFQPLEDSSASFAAG